LAKKARESWAESSKEIAATGDDKLVTPEFANQGDNDLVW
jgi:antitoxin MazE